MDKLIEIRVNLKVLQEEIEEEAHAYRRVFCGLPRGEDYEEMSRYFNLIGEKLSGCAERIRQTLNMFPVDKDE